VPLPVFAVITFTFDPVVSIGGFNVRLETIGIAVGAFLALVVAASIARVTPIDLSRPPDAPGPEPGEQNHLRADDLLYISVAALPGAVIGGRIGYILLHWNYYQANAELMASVGQGGFELPLAVVGACVTGGVVGALLGAPVGRWMHALVLPVLLAITVAKAAQVLGGTGQGVPTDVSWATAYLGPGPWGSLAPEIPSHPAQVYEAIATALSILVVMWFVELGAFPGRNGGAFLLGLALWCGARTVIGIVARERAVAGPLSMDQVISLSISIACVLLLLLVGGAATVRGRRRQPGEEAAAVAGGTAAVPAAGGGTDWPDPEARPRI
jgi:phosphatidylglycerol---prolipoprotein diacylglyceryl transferase